MYRVCSSQLSSSLRSGVAGGAPGSLPTSLSALLTDGAALAQAPTATLGARACPVGAGAVHDVCASVRSPACDAYVARMAAAWEESSAAPAAAAAAAAAPPLAVAVAALEDLSLNRTAPDSRCVAALLQAFSAAGRGVRAIDILASCAQGVMSALTSPAPPEGAAAQGGRPATPSEAWGCAVDVVLSAEAVCAALGALGCEGRPDLCLWLWRAYGRACEERARRAGARRELAAPAHQPASPYAAPWVQGREPVTLELPPREACAVHATVVGALCCALTSACTLVAAPSPLRAPLWDTSLPSSAAAQAASGLLAAAAAAEGGGGGGGGGSGSGSGSGRPCAEFSAASAALTAMAEAINGVHAGWGGASFASGGRDTHTPQPAPLPAAALAALAVWHRYSGSKAASRHLQSTLFQGVSRFELGGGGSSGGSGVAALGGGSTRALALPGAGSAEEPNDLQSFLAMLWSSTQCGAGSLTRELLAHASRPGALPLAPLLAPPSADSSSSSSSSGGSAAARQLSCTALAASLWYAGHASRGDVECETGAGQALRSTLGSIHNPLRSIFDAACAPASAAAGSDQLAHQNLLPLVQRLALAAEEGAGGSSAAAAAAAAAAAGTPVYAPAAPLAAAALTPSAVKPYDSPALTPISHLAANLRCAFLVSSGNLARAITEFMCCHAAPPAASPGEAAAPGSLSGAAAQWAAVRPSAGAASGTAAAPSPPLGAPYSPAVFAPFPETLTLLLHGIVSDCGAFGRSASRLALPAWLLSQPSPAPTSLLGAVGAGAGAGGAGAPTVVDSAGAVLSLVTRVLYAADARGVSPRLADYAAVAELHGVLGTCRLALADIRGGGGSGGSGAAAAAAEPGEGGAASAVGTWGRAGATLLYASVLSGMARSGGSVLRREDVEWLGARAAEDGVGFPRLLGAGGSVGADTLAYRSGLFTGLSAEEGEAIPSYFSAAVEAVDAGLRGEEGAGAGGGGGGGGGGGEDAHFSAATVARPSAWTAHAIFGTTREGGASYAASLAADRSYTSAALPSLASNSSQSTAEAVAAAAAAPPAGVQPSALAHLVTLSLPSLRAASASAALGLMLTRCLSYELCGASAVSAAQRLAAGRGALTPSALATLLSFTKSRGSSASSASAASLASLAGSGSPSAGAGKAALLASEARAVPPPILFLQQQQEELQQLQQFQQSASSQFVTLSFSEYDRERAAEVEGASQSASSASASTPSKRLLPFGAWRSSAPVSSLMPGASAAHSGASAASAQLGTASRPLSLQASLEAARVPPPVSAALLSGGWAYGTSAQITSAASFGGGSSALAPMALPLTVASLLASSSAWAYDTVGHLPSADEARAGSEAAQLALARASGAPSAFALELPTLFSALATASPCQAEYAEDAQGQPLVHAATLSEHTHTLEAQLRSVHRETADLEAQLLGLSGALMLCESDLCASLSASRDSQRMVGAAMVGACRVTGEAIPGMLITGEEGGAAVAAGAAAAAAGETALPARLVLMSQRSALLKLLQAQEAEALDLERVLLGTREADGGEGGPPQPLRLHAAAAGQAPEAWPGGGSSRSTPYPPQHPSQFNLSTVSPLVLPASRMLQRYFSASLGMEENCRELSAAAARDEAAALALEDSLSLSQAALRSWALSNMTQGAVADASQGGRVFSQPAPHPKAAALLAALSTAPVNAAVRDLRKGRVRARETLRSAAASADALAAVLDSYVEAGEARVAAKRECARAAVAGEVELEALHSAGTALETSARMAMWALEKRRKEVAERHQAESRALADSIARVRSSMMAEMGNGSSGAGRGTVMHLSTALLLGASTPSSVASAAGILAAREAMLGGAIALGESTAAAAGALALEEERANSEHGAALAREEVNKLLSNRAHKRAGEHVMAWAQPASLLEEHCLEQEEALTSARDLGALVAGESAVLAALQRELEAARQEWTYTATLLDARNFARNATREALAADKAASAATAGSNGARALSFFANEAAQGAGPMGQSQGQYNSQIEELCGLFGECGGTALELWTLVSRAIEPLQRQGTAALAPSGPRHSAPAEAGVSLSILDTVVDLLEEELGAYRASILATPLGSVTTSLPSAELSASLSSLRRSPYSSGSPASPVTPSVVRYLAAAM